MYTTKLLTCCSLLVTMGCGHTPVASSRFSSDRIVQMVHKNRSDIDVRSLRAILVITEQGCITCNREFSTLVAKHLDDPNVLFWVSARGTEINISDFKVHPDYVFWDYNQDMARSGLLEGSGALLLQNGHVDTIISLDARYLETTLEYVNDYLNTPKKSILKK